MASLQPADRTDLTRTSEMDRRFTEAELRMDLRFERMDAQFEALEHKLTASFESAFGKQTKWVVGGMGALAVSMLGIVISILTLG